MNEALNAVSPLDGRYAKHIDPLRPIFSEYGLIKKRVHIEIEWLVALSLDPELKEIPRFNQTTQKKLKTAAHKFSLKDAQAVKTIEQTTNHDVKAIEYWLKKTFKNDKSVMKVSEFIHFACTSEDINNLAYALMLKEGIENVILPKIEAIKNDLKGFAKQYADVALLARTHGQTASPTTLGKEFANVAYRLERQIKSLKTQPILGKINGAVGNFNAHLIAYPKKDWNKFSQKFIKALGLSYNEYTTQIEPHDFAAEIFNNLSLINTILIDLNRDIWSYISIGYFKQRMKKNEVGSSTMPHKVNPIDFENSEGNLGLANAILRHLSEKLPISRWQRDLTDSTVLRNIGVAFGYSLIAYQSLGRGLGKLQVNQVRINEDLDNAWEVLAEPIQTIMRKRGIANPYEKLKELTRGNQNIDRVSLHQFINTLELPMQDKKTLLDLTPQSYIGLAAKLAKKI
ncbi:MAG: adenylosuccinate lyase [Methylophilaceae bacterium]|jgi:adenylosuccinate lyase